LLTALLVTLLFIWLRKITSAGLAFLLAIAGGFGTMLWPYAYIGLETTQSFFLILGGYLALMRGPIRSYTQALLFGLCCAVAVSAKSTGIVLFPAVLFLLYLQFRAKRRGLAAVALGSIALIWTANAICRTQYWTALGGAFRNVRPLLIDSPFLFFANVIGMFGSPNKGLFIFAPPLLFSVYAVPKAWRAHRDITTFALLAVGGVVAGFAFLRFFADETWGPRYLHSCVAPLLLVIGASRRRFSLRRDALLVPLTALGIGVSFFGTLYYYGILHRAAVETGQNTAEQLNGDPVLNQVRFNARLFAVWLKHSPAQVSWTPRHLWIYSRPPELPPDKNVDLNRFSQPQAFIVRHWGVPRPAPLSVVFAVLIGFAVIGPLLLTAAGILIWTGRVRDLNTTSKPAPLPAASGV
jgi:hypothetical protein